MLKTLKRYSVVECFKGKTGVGFINFVQVCSDYAQLTAASAERSCQSLDRRKEEKKLYRSLSLRHSKSTTDCVVKQTISNKE